MMCQPDPTSPGVAFASTDAYGASLRDARFWTPWVHAVLRDLGFPQRQPVIAGAAGTFPTMLVGEGGGRTVVKFFGPLFHGPACAAIEREMYALLARDPAIPAPRLLGTATLDPGTDWPWEVIVSTVMTGESLAQARNHDAGSVADGERIARFLATTTDRIAALTPGPDDRGVDALLADDWETFLRSQASSCAERHRAWGDLPPHLIGQLDGWIDVEALLTEGDSPRTLIHGDLTADHIFGSPGPDGGCIPWEPTGLIDFGDARIADRRYDLIPLFVDGFDGDRPALRAYLAAIDADLTGGDFPRSMLALTLLHEFRVLGAWLDAHPEGRAVPTLDVLATAMWGD